MLHPSIEGIALADYKKAAAAGLKKFDACMPGALRLIETRIFLNPKLASLMSTVDLKKLRGDDNGLSLLYGVDDCYANLVGDVRETLLTRDLVPFLSLSLSL